MPVINRKVSRKSSKSQHLIRLLCTGENCLQDFTTEKVAFTIPYCYKSQIQFWNILDFKTVISAIRFFFLSPKASHEHQFFCCQIKTTILEYFRFQDGNLSHFFFSPKPSHEHQLFCCQIKATILEYFRFQDVNLSHMFFFFSPKASHEHQLFCCQIKATFFCRKIVTFTIPYCYKSQIQFWNILDFKTVISAIRFFFFPKVSHEHQFFCCQIEVYELFTKKLPCFNP